MFFKTTSGTFINLDNVTNIRKTLSGYDVSYLDRYGHYIEKTDMENLETILKRNEMLIEGEKNMNLEKFITVNDETKEMAFKRQDGWEMSDGHHTFRELYYHRMILFSIICTIYKDRAWKSKIHHDGTMFNGDFIVGITTDEGDYSYHYKLKFWDMFDVKELETAPVYDGHKPKDVTRLLSLLESEQ